MNMIKYQYTPICKENQLILGTGQIAIVTGWTPKEKIAKLFSPDQYAVIGNLYSKGGIDFLVRNLLANPHVTVVIIISSTIADVNSGATKCLHQFFKEGDLKNIGEDIPKKDINKLLTNTFWHWVESINELQSRAKMVLGTSSKYAPSLPKRDAVIYPPPNQQSDILPGQLYGQRVEGKTVADVWVKILHRIRTNGIIRKSGYDDRQELINLMAIVTDEDPDKPSIPDPNWLPVDLEYLQSYYPQMIEDSPYVDGVKYTYGQRLRSWFGCDQIEQVINKICDEKDTASAVMNLWDSGSGNHTRFLLHSSIPDSSITRYKRIAGDSDHEHSGSPCLNHIWIRVIDDVLTMTAIFRSNDMFQAWATNAYGLRKLQEHIRVRINEETGWLLTLGSLITISQSAHIYDFSFSAADEVITTQYIKICNRERLKFDDAVGNFLVEVVTKTPKGTGGQAFAQFIQVTQMDKEGNTVRKYESDMHQPLKLIREIVETNPSISSSHAAYLGIEIQKANSQGNEYIQDK